MKKLILLLLFPWFTAGMSAETIVQCLHRVNKEVLLQKDIPPSWSQTTCATVNFTEAIQLHLTSVIQVLRIRDQSHLDEQQKHNRETLLSALERYAKTGIFPINEHAPFQTPVFIDRRETHCAVGYLMQQSGSETLARSIQHSGNLAYIREIKTPGVSIWAEKNGFTVDELAWIQPGYPPATIVSPLLGGVNGTVNAIMYYNGELIAAGSFNEADGQTANNIASYIAGFAGFLWTETMGGTNGPVHALDTINNRLIAAGYFTMAGTSTVSNIAQLGNEGWEAMGSALDGFIYDLEWHEGTLYAAGDFQFSDGSDIAKWNGAEWISLGWGTNGLVRCLRSTSDGLLFGGEFSLVDGTPLLNIGKIFNGTAEAMGAGIATVVYDVENWNNTPTIAAALKENGNVYGLMQYTNAVWESLPGIAEIAQGDSTGILYCLHLNMNELFVGGDYDVFDLMTFGNNLAKWPTNTDFPRPIAVFDSTVFCLMASQETMYTGGEFTHHLGTEINHIAQLNNVLVTKDVETKKPVISAFPIPSANEVNLRNTGPAQWIKVFSMEGKLIENFLLTDNRTLMLPASGVFLLQAENGEQLTLIRH